MNKDELIKLIAYLWECLEEMEASHKKEREDSAERISALMSEVLVRSITPSCSLAGFRDIPSWNTLDSLSR